VEQTRYFEYYCFADKNTNKEEGGLFHIYIITYDIELENQKDYVIQVEPPAELSDILRSAENINYQSYQIEYRRHHEVICPRYTFTDGSSVIVIPWFLIPGRPYPIQVYIRACSLYSTNPGMGQRAVAEATRTEFGLEKFSHSTVSRSFRAFEHSRKESLALRFGDEIKSSGAESRHFISAAAKGVRNRGEAPGSAGRFPSATDTATRRDELSGFFQELLRDRQELNIESASLRFIKKWNKTVRRLLL